MIEKGYVDTADGQIHYRHNAGHAGIPLVFFHMTASTSESYEPLMRELDGKIRTYAFDTPHYGESFHPSGSGLGELEYIADILLEAIDALGIEKFHAFGHHTGASIALQLAWKYPERVASAILSGIVSVSPEEGEQLRQTLARTNHIDDYGRQLMQAWTRQITTESPLVEYPAHIKHRETVSTLRAGENWHYAYNAVFTDDAGTKLDQVTRPIFFVLGGEDLALPYHSREVERHPEFASYVHPGHGVFYNESAPHDLGKRVLDFVAGVEG